MGLGVLSRLLARCAVLAVMLLCTDLKAASSPSTEASVATLLAQAEQAAGANSDQFGILLERLHQSSGRLTQAQQWRLRELDAWRLSFEGDSNKADPIFRNIIKHSGDPSVSALAMSWLIEDELRDHHYVEAYALANTLMEDLPKIPDPRARLVGLGRVIDILNSSTVGQYDLALTYARQMKASFPSAVGQCTASVHETKTLLFAGDLSSDSPRFKKTIDLCMVANRPLLVGLIRLERAGAMVDEGYAKRAIVDLRRMAPAIQKTHYPAYIAMLSLTSAQAYQRLGSATKARELALASLATPGINGSQWLAQAAYEVLYKAEKEIGHDAAALAYYEKYVALEKAAMDDAKARALAYQMVKQQVQAKKMELDALSKQNRILQLRQALASQAQKTSRLFSMLLLVVIAFIVLAMLWLWRSRLRFQWMARHDGLTGVCNREHFFEDAGRTLRRLHRIRSDTCLVVLDLDHFKRVNDTYGHAVGDEVLRRTVTIMRQELGDSGLLGRLGGEEFGILMPACSREQGQEVASRIRRALAATPMVLESKITIMVSASFGLACSTGSVHTLRQLLVEADAALYRAKDGGRNQVVTDARDDASAMVQSPDGQVTLSR